ncbi:SMI1/KNR4 family protein [Paenibacillus turpanensis]|uniref:SMI1/KNR4 family protein n=1 Tax=Paenibacillus turpanensis TaxID=2689078 RepID=UPI00140DEAF3|nr:SMI1/KNR4 family protein [Paenibacillus turpanensis]
MSQAFNLLDLLLAPSVEKDGGYSHEEISQKERELRILFPDVLRSYYAAYGKCKYITQNCNNQYEPIKLQDVFIPDAEFFTTDKDYLVFYQCAESVIYCGIKLSELHLVDPPVYLCAWSDPNWYFENDSLSNFLVCKALVQIAVEGRLPYWAFVEEGPWQLTDYLTLWKLSDEIKESTHHPAWTMFWKNDTLYVFESALGDDENEVLGVHLASFYKERIEEALSCQMHERRLPSYSTNVMG